MEGEGFEPPNPKERIYSPPRLASSLPFLIIELMARDGIEPPTHGASIHCSTNWATEPNCGSRIWTYDLRVMSPTSYRAAPSRVNIKEDVGFEPTHAFTRLPRFQHGLLSLLSNLPWIKNMEPVGPQNVNVSTLWELVNLFVTPFFIYLF